MRNAECEEVSREKAAILIPHSQFRIPHFPSYDLLISNCLTGVAGGY